MLWISLLEIALGVLLIAWKKPNRQVSIRWFTAGVLLILFGMARILIW
ncbi:MAG TPA: hypothetical protein VJQ82_02985 [Terriglobales bacterium]|nr:hypothetical protein [Terriglobales bacterium]